MGDLNAKDAKEKTQRAQRGNSFARYFAPFAFKSRLKAIRKVARERDPGIPVVPTMLTSSTDSPTFRSAGITAYGFEPYKMDDNELNRAHGNDERLSVENVGFALHFLYDVMMELNQPDGSR